MNTTIHYFVCAFWVLFPFSISWIILVCKLYMCDKHLYTFLMDINLNVELLSYGGSTYSALVDTSKEFSDVAAISSHQQCMRCWLASHHDQPRAPLPQRWFFPVTKAWHFWILYPMPCAWWGWSGRNRLCHWALESFTYWGSHWSLWVVLFLHSESFPICMVCTVYCQILSWDRWQISRFLSAHSTLFCPIKSSHLALLISWTPLLRL